MPNIHLTHIGGPTLLIEVAGVRLLTDPTFDGPGSYDLGTVTLTKQSAPALAREALGRIDAVLLSHDHPDHLDHSGRTVLAAARRSLTSAGAARRVPDAEGLSPWETRVVVGDGGETVAVTATPARHGPPGVEALMGDVIGFVVSVPGSGDALYISGDTVWYEGTAEVARRFEPAVAVLFAGAARTRGPFRLTMDANDALEAARAFPASTLVAIHNEGWAHFTETSEALGRAFAVLGQTSRLLSLEPGRTATLALAGKP